MTPDDEIMKLLQDLQELLDDFNYSESFQETISGELRRTILEHYPSYKEYLPLCEERLLFESQFASRLIYQNVQECFAEDGRNAMGYIPIDYPTRQEVEERLLQRHENILSSAEPDEYEELSRECAEDYADRMKYETFRLACCSRLKAIVFQFFPDIVELSGNSIRILDNKVYSVVSMWGIEFQDMIYCCTDEDSPEEDA